MKKVVFHGNIKYYILQVIFISIFSCLIFDYTSILLDDNIYKYTYIIIVMRIPFICFGTMVLFETLLNMFGYMVLSSDEIAFYVLFIPIAIIKINTVPHIEIVWNSNFGGYYEWLILSDMSTSYDETVDMVIMFVDFFPKIIKRLFARNRNIKSVKISYTQKYDRAIRDFYGIGANMWQQ